MSLLDKNNQSVTEQQHLIQEESSMSQENPFRITRERFIEGIRSGFPASYLTVLSIVQGVALSALIFNAADAFKDGITISAPFLMLISFGNLIMVWYEYSWLVRIYTWEPGFIDAMIPFMLGVLEIVPTFFFERPFEWTIATICFILSGACGAWNTRRHTTAETFDDYKSGLGKKCSMLWRRRVTAGLLWLLFLTGLFSSLLPLAIGNMTASDHWILGTVYVILILVTYAYLVWSYSEMSNEVLRFYEIPVASHKRTLHKLWHKAKFLSLWPCSAVSAQPIQKDSVTK